jgi:hypothetical protein
MDHAHGVAGPPVAQEGTMGMRHDSYHMSAPADCLPGPGLAAAAGRRVLVALVLALIAAGATGAALGASPTFSLPPLAEPPHLRQRRVFTLDEAARAEAFAAHIESAGGGRVVVYTEPEPAQLPDASTIAARWHVDGLLISGSGGSMTSLRATMGDTLKGRLGADQVRCLSENTMSGAIHGAPGWTMSTLARVDAFLGSRLVFDGAGVLDAAGLQQAETAATNLAASSEPRSASTSRRPAPTPPTRRSSTAPDLGRSWSSRWPDDETSAPIDLTARYGTATRPANPGLATACRPAPSRTATARPWCSMPSAPFRSRR